MAIDTNSTPRTRADAADMVADALIDAAHAARDDSDLGVNSLFSDDTSMTVTNSKGESATLDRAALNRLGAALGTSRPKSSASPTKKYRVPAVVRFQGSAYLGASDLEIIANQLIGTTFDFERLETLRITYRWKAKGGTSKGVQRFGGIERVSGQALAFLEDEDERPELLVWLAADACRDYEVTELQVEALLFDQLCSVTFDEEDEGESQWSLVGPDVVAHLAALEKYGPYTKTLQKAKPAFSQPSMFEGGSA